MTTDRQQRREVTDQARRCFRSSWEDCEDAVDMETRLYCETHDSKLLTSHFGAACPEMQVLDVIDFLGTSNISTGFPELIVDGRYCRLEFILL